MSSDKFRTELEKHTKPAAKPESKPQTTPQDAYKHGQQSANIFKASRGLK